MTTTVCPICSHPTRYPRSNPDQWECTFCGTRGVAIGNIQLDKYSTSILYTYEPSSFTVAEKPGGLKYDDGKLQYGLIPPETTKALAEVLTFGAKKYAKDNWKLLENGKERYLDALYRHLDAYRTGEYLDSESSLPHLSHCLCNLAFIHFFETQDRKL